MLHTLNLRVAPEVAGSDLRLLTTVSDQLGIDGNRITGMRITRRSIDARQRQVMVNLTVKVGVDEPFDPKPELTPVHYPDVTHAPEAIVVGAGPAGLFAALELIKSGVKPIVVERGKDVDERRKDLALIARENKVDPDSNYCFGEGGAGAYSDGKLYTRSKKRGSVTEVLETFYRNGAPESVLIDAHPHIGTDRLPAVIRSIRDTIINYGGEVRFNTRVERLIIDGDECRGVTLAGGGNLYGPVILATGHSARDLYERLYEQGVEMEAKGIAVGVRLEHPQQLIDSIQYHKPGGRGKFLPPAEYSLLTRVDGRAVYSFCMCPGGIIVPCASGPDQQAVNGMSPSNRGSRWANAGMVVEVLPEDVEPQSADPLKVMHYQAKIEKRFLEESGGSHNAPAQRMHDFVNSKPSRDLPPTSYAPGIHPSRIDQLLPAPIARRLQRGFVDFGRKQRGFLTNEAALIGAETRTSSPVRIIRDGDTLRHVRLLGLYPCGEGAGYAGGIVSAAIDGQRCARALAASLRNRGV